MLQIHLKSNGMPYTLKNTMKPNFRSAEWQHLTTKALGFTRSVVDVACLENTWFFYGFYGFDGIRSTQPTKTKCITFSITPSTQPTGRLFVGVRSEFGVCIGFENTMVYTLNASHFPSPPQPNLRDYGTFICWGSLGLWLMWRVSRILGFSMVFTVLMESVQPNLRRLNASHFLSPPQPNLRDVYLLGFTRSVVDVACLENTWFFYGFYGFDGIRSTQPTKTKCITFFITRSTQPTGRLFVGVRSEFGVCIGFENTMVYTLNTPHFPSPPQPNLRDVYLLGFTRSVVDVACLENTWFFYGFYGFDGIRSTQPTKTVETQQAKTPTKTILADR